MASKIDVSALTLNPEEASEIGSAIIEAEFVNGPLAETHEPHTGITHKMQIPFVGRLPDSLKKSAGCTPNEGGVLTMSEKFWDPEKFDSRFTHCAADLNNLLKLFKKYQKINPDFYDRIDSEELGLVAARVAAMVRESLPVKFWFSDTAADVVAEGGVFSAGTDLDLFNVFDGWFKQLFAIVPTSASNYIAISENAGVNYAAQVLAADKAFDTFVKMRKAADSRLLEDPNIQIECTRTMAENYRDTLRNKSLGAGFLETTENGKTVLKFDGIPVYVNHEFDRIIKSVQDNGTKWNLPHRAIMSTPDNLPYGTTSEDDFETLESFYDQYLKSNIMDIAMSLDAKVLEGYKVVFAY